MNEKDLNWSCIVQIGTQIGFDRLHPLGNYCCYDNISAVRKQIIDNYFMSSDTFPFRDYLWMFYRLISHRVWFDDIICLISPPNSKRFDEFYLFLSQNISSLCTPLHHPRTAVRTSSPRFNPGFLDPARNRFFPEMKWITRPPIRAQVWFLVFDL